MVYMTPQQSGYGETSILDRVGLLGMALLLMSPIIFKIQLTGNLIVHPSAILLFAAWCWTGGVVSLAIKREGEIPVALRTVGTPLLLVGWMIGAQVGSLALNSLYRGSWQSGGWLLLLKQVLYVAPLPFVALLVYRTPQRTIQLLSYGIPLVALLTLAYSGVRFRQALGGFYTNTRSDSVLQYVAMGTFGEVLTRDGLMLRFDTIGQGAYGMYLVLILTFSLTLTMFHSWGAQLPRWYPWGQALVVCPLAVVGIMFTGSRTSFILMSGVVLMLVGLLFTTRIEGLSRRRQTAFMVFVMLLAVMCMVVKHHAPRVSTSLDRALDTVQYRFNLDASAAPFGDKEEDRSTSVAHNVDMRIWLWGKTIRYLRDHPQALLIGIGHDRKRFLEEVIGLPYEGNLIHFHTAHNLFLDTLAKGGLMALAPLLILCMWVFRLAYSCLQSSTEKQSLAVSGAGCLLFLFWPPFVLANLFGEEMFTDNLQLHWTILLGVLCGLWRGQTIPSSRTNSARKHFLTPKKYAP